MRNFRPFPAPRMGRTTIGGMAAALALTALVALASPQAARAQAVVALVNSKPITSFDIDQRIRIAQLVERRRLDRKTALNDLIDDQVKIIEARRIGYRVTEEGVEQELNKLARANGMTEPQFEDALRKSGLSAAALRDKYRADLAWGALLRDRARRGSQVSNEEVEREYQERQRTAKPLTEFELQPVVFVVARGASTASAERLAAAARAKFTSCETSLEELRAMPEVALRATMRRNSDELQKPLLELLNKTPVGRLTAPQRTEQGLEMVAVCSKRERENPSTQKVGIAAELAEKRVSGSVKTYLEELRKKVEIRYPR